MPKKEKSEAPAKTESITVLFCGAARGHATVPRGTTMRDAAEKCGIDLANYAWQDVHDGSTEAAHDTWTTRPLERDTTYTLVPKNESDEKKENAQ